MRPSAIPTSATTPGAPVPSTTVAPLMISSSTGSPDLAPEKSLTERQIVALVAQSSSGTKQGDEAAPLPEAGRRRGVDERTTGRRSGAGAGGGTAPRSRRPNKREKAMAD